MASQMRMYCILGMTVYMGFVLLLSVGSKNSTAAVFQVTELAPGIENPYDAASINAFSLGALLDREYFVNVFGMSNVPPEIGLPDATITRPPVPTIAFLFPFALILLLSQRRRLVEKMYNYFAFPVF
jgi:hypothetical protein